MKKILVFGVCCVFALTLAAQEVEKAVRIHPVGHLARPYLYRDPTAQTQCVAVPATDHTSADVGELVEIDCRYLDEPGCEPVADAAVTDGDAVAPSNLGFRPIEEAAPGTRAVAFFFDAVRPGVATVTLTVDGQDYPYVVHVSEPQGVSRPDAVEAECESFPEAGARLIRPYPATGFNCSMVPHSGTFAIEVGDLVEIDYLTFTDNRVSCMKMPKIGLHNAALAPSPLGSVYIYTGTYGVSRVATFFEAVQPGKARITLKIGGRAYNYRFVVSEGISR